MKRSFFTLAIVLLAVAAQAQNTAFKVHSSGQITRLESDLAFLTLFMFWEMEVFTLLEVIIPSHPTRRVQPKRSTP